MATPPQSLPPIVIVDDDPNDLFLLCDRLRRAGVTNPLQPFDSAENAMAFLKDSAASHCKPACLLLTDLKMPGLGGLELAGWIRGHAQLREIPIAIISGGDEPRDRAKAMKLGASYYTKFPRKETLASLIGTKSHS